MKSFYLIIFLLITINGYPQEDRGLFSFKPKPGDKLEAVSEILDAEDKSYYIKDEIKIKTNFGTVKFPKGYYVVSQKFISEHDTNQKDLIDCLVKIKSSNNKITNYKIISITSILLCLILFTFNIYLLKRKS